MASRIAASLSLFEQGVQVPAGGEAEQGTELVFGEAALAESFKAQGFEGDAGGVLAGRDQGSGQLVGNVQRNVHASV